MNKKKVTYIFGSGRLTKIENNEKFAKEMYYGYFELSKIYNTKIVETVYKSSKLKNFFTKVLKRLTGLGIHFENNLSKKDKKRIIDSDEVFFGNQQVLLSFLFWLPSLKTINTNVFVMGLFLGESNFYNKILLKYLIKNVTRCIFIGEEEFRFANKNFPEFSDKFFFIPFGVDIDFWANEKNQLTKTTNSVLFIGNDLHRDYLFLNTLVNAMPNINFTIITSRLSKSNISLKNVELINGHWHSNEVTDLDIKKYYNNSAITIIPLKNTFQPSGQSVALQSMACGTPVIVTDTVGFWDSRLIHKKHLFKLNSDIETWVETINNLISDRDVYKSVQKNSTESILNNFNTKLFNSALIELIAKK